MKVPSWSYVVGIIMMLFGGCDVLSSMSTASSDITTNFESKFEEGFEHGYENHRFQEIDSSYSDSTMRSERKEETFKRIQEIAENSMNTSDFTLTWIRRFGIIGSILGLVYILGGLFLMIPKSFSIKLAYGALLASISFSIIMPLVLASDASLGIFTILSGFSGIFSVIIDVILLVVIVASDKTVYRDEVIYE